MADLRNPFGDDLSPRNLVLALLARPAPLTMPQVALDAPAGLAADEWHLVLGVDGAPAVTHVARPEVAGKQIDPWRMTDTPLRFAEVRFCEAVENKSLADRSKTAWRAGDKADGPALHTEHQRQDSLDPSSSSLSQSITQARQMLRSR
jgi:hypothetical protein